MNEVKGYPRNEKYYINILISFLFKNVKHFSKKSKYLIITMTSFLGMRPFNNK